MTVEVTQADIDNGARGSCVSCPIALAINRTFHPYPTALVSSKHLAFGYYDRETDVVVKVDRDTPRKLRKFIHAFDHKQVVSPFKFRL